jgi:epoxyqueuosine reductase
VKRQIALQARELGFDACRVTTAASPETSPEFENWLASRRHGEMAYLARTSRKRTDPQQVLPGAKSIITLAASYAGEESNQYSVSSIRCGRVRPCVAAPAIRPLNTEH